MSLKRRYLVSLLLLLLSLSTLSVRAENPRTLHWDDLLPAADLEALINPPEYLNEIDDGSLKIRSPMA